MPDHIFLMDRQGVSGLAAKSIAGRLGADEAEADIVVPVVRVVVVPIG